MLLDLSKSTNTRCTVSARKYLINLTGIYVFWHCYFIVIVGCILMEVAVDCTHVTLIYSYMMVGGFYDRHCRGPDTCMRHNAEKYSGPTAIKSSLIVKGTIPDTNEKRMGLRQITLNMG